MGGRIETWLRAMGLAPERVDDSVNRFFRRLDKERTFWKVTALEFGPSGRPLAWLLVLIIIILVLLTFGSVRYLPAYLHPLLSESELAEVGLDKRVELQEARRALQNQAMTTLLQGIGVLVLLVGTGIGWYITRQGQISERFTRAIDQLGDNRLDVRLGGIYALGRIARNSGAHRPEIIQILAAYVYGHSPRVTDAERRPANPHAPEKSSADDSSIGDPQAQEFVQRLQMRDIDVQAVISIITEYHPWVTVPPLLLANVDLRRAALGHARLREAILFHADLRGAGLFGADLRHAILTEADLREAILSVADLRWANLVDADLRGAELIDADLRWTRLHGAHLEEAILDRADLRNALANEVTTWPDGFDEKERRRRGIILW